MTRRSRDPFPFVRWFFPRGLIAAIVPALTNRVFHSDHHEALYCSSHCSQPTVSSCHGTDLRTALLFWRQASPLMTGYVEFSELILSLDFTLLPSPTPHHLLNLSTVQPPTQEIPQRFAPNPTWVHHLVLQSPHQMMTQFTTTLQSMTNCCIPHSIRTGAR